MAVVDPRIAGKPVPRISKEAMERDSVARASKVKGSDLAFLDQRIPAHEASVLVELHARSSTWSAWVSPRTQRCVPT